MLQTIKNTLFPSNNSQNELQKYCIVLIIILPFEKPESETKPEYPSEEQKMLEVRLLCWKGNTKSEKNQRFYVSVSCHTCGVPLVNEVSCKSFNKHAFLVQLSVWYKAAATSEGNFQANTPSSPKVKVHFPPQQCREM